MWQAGERWQRVSDRQARRGRGASALVAALLLATALLESGGARAIGPLRGPCGKESTARPSAPRAPHTVPARAGMSFQAALAQAEELNREGNALFGAKRYDEALAKYSGAAELVEVHAQRITEAEAPWCKFLCNSACVQTHTHTHTHTHTQTSGASFCATGRRPTSGRDTMGKHTRTAGTNS